MLQVSEARTRTAAESRDVRNVVVTMDPRTAELMTNFVEVVAKKDTSRNLLYAELTVVTTTVVIVATTIAVTTPDTLRTAEDHEDQSTVDEVRDVCTMYAQDDDCDEHYGRNEEFYDGDREVLEMCDMFDTMYCEFDVSDVNVITEDVSDFNAVLDVNGKPLSVELDTGARCNILSRKSLERLRVRYQMKPSSLYIRGVHGKCVKAVGAVTLPCAYKGVLRNIEFQILDGSKEINLPGRTDCVNFGLIARINQVNVSNPSEEIVKQYNDVFDGEIGCLPGEYDIQIDESFTPVVHPPRPVPVALREKVIVELQRLEAAGIIKKVAEPTPWVNSMVVVNKKDSERVRKNQ